MQQTRLEYPFQFHYPSNTLPLNVIIATVEGGIRRDVTVLVARGRGTVVEVLIREDHKDVSSSPALVIQTFSPHPGRRLERTATKMAEDKIWDMCK